MKKIIATMLVLTALLFPLTSFAGDGDDEPKPLSTTSTSDNS